MNMFSDLLIDIDEGRAREDKVRRLAIVIVVIMIIYNIDSCVERDFLLLLCPSTFIHSFIHSYFLSFSCHETIY